MAFELATKQPETAASLNHCQSREQAGYDTISHGCAHFNTEIDKLIPLARQMHLLSSNAVSCAVRAGTAGNAFRVLTQDIQLLAEDISRCTDSAQKNISNIVVLASRLTRSSTRYDESCTSTERPELQKMSVSECESTCDHIATDINTMTLSLGRSLLELGELLSPLSRLVKKGHYLTVFLSVEAASAKVHGVKFGAVADLLRELVGQLDTQTNKQLDLLKDINEVMDTIRPVKQDRFYTH